MWNCSQPDDEGDRNCSKNCLKMFSQSQWKPEDSPDHDRDEITVCTKSFGKTSSDRMRAHAMIYAMANTGGRNITNAETYATFAAQLSRHDLATQPSWKGFLTAIGIWIEDHQLAAACILGGVVLALFALATAIALCCHRRKGGRAA